MTLTVTLVTVVALACLASTAALPAPPTAAPALVDGNTQQDDYQPTEAELAQATELHDSYRHYAELPLSFELPRVEHNPIPFYAPEPFSYLTAPHENQEANHYLLPEPSQQLVAPAETVWNPNNDPKYFYEVPAFLTRQSLPTFEYPKKYNKEVHYKFKPFSSKPKQEIVLEPIDERQYESKQKDLHKVFEHAAKKNNQKEIEEEKVNDDDDDDEEEERYYKNDNEDDDNRSDNNDNDDDDENRSDNTNNDDDENQSDNTQNDDDDNTDNTENRSDNKGNDNEEQNDNTESNDENRSDNTETDENKSGSAESDDEQTPENAETDEKQPENAETREPKPDIAETDDKQPANAETNVEQQPDNTQTLEQKSDITESNDKQQAENSEPQIAQTVTADSEPKAAEVVVGAPTENRGQEVDSQLTASLGVPSYAASAGGDRINFHMVGHDGPDSYKFGYDTGKGHNRQFRFEEKDKTGLVKGHYGFFDKNGKLQMVHYDSHPNSGFRAEGNFGIIR